MSSWWEFWRSVQIKARDSNNTSNVGFRSILGSKWAVFDSQLSQFSITFRVIKRNVFVSVTTGQVIPMGYAWLLRRPTDFFTELMLADYSYMYIMAGFFPDLARNTKAWEPWNSALLLRQYLLRRFKPREKDFGSSIYWELMKLILISNTLGVKYRFSKNIIEGDKWSLKS